VLSPGLTVNAHIFDGVIKAGLRPRFRVLGLDLRGPGESDAPPAGFHPAAPAANYTLADHAADVVGVLSRLNHSGWRGESRSNGCPQLDVTCSCLRSGCSWQTRQARRLCGSVPESVGGASRAFH
jgi:hypothetical protein